MHLININDTLPTRKTMKIDAKMHTYNTNIDFRLPLIFVPIKFTSVYNTLIREHTNCQMTVKD